MNELDYVDITIFFKKKQCLAAIEIKTGPASSDHFSKIRGYEDTLHGKLIETAHKQQRNILDDLEGNLASSLMAA